MGSAVSSCIPDTTTIVRLRDASRVDARILRMANAAEGVAIVRKSNGDIETGCDGWHGRLERTYVRATPGEIVVFQPARQGAPGEVIRPRDASDRLLIHAPFHATCVSRTNYTWVASVELSTSWASVESIVRTKTGRPEWPWFMAIGVPLAAAGGTAVGYGLFAPDLTTAERAALSTVGGVLLVSGVTYIAVAIYNLTYGTETAVIYEQRK
jgi:hypothetical protein